MGAGPAGLAAAITLAQAGREVVVYERAVTVGSRREGDLEALENFTTSVDVLEEWRAWGIGAHFSHAGICAGTWFGPEDGQEATVHDGQPLLYFVRRGSAPGTLDTGLLAQALAAGVRVEFRRRCTVQEADIVASGMVRPGAYGVGYNFCTDAPDGAYVAYDDRLTPRTYSYLALCQGRGTLVACAMRPQSGMKHVLPLVAERFQRRVSFTMREPRYFAAALGLGMPQTATVNGRYYVGEAGLFQDVFAGFGIRMAVTSGYLAARSIVEGNDFDALWQRRYRPLMRAAAVNRWLQERLGNRGYALMLRYLRWFGKHGNGRTLMRRRYHPGWYGTLLWPLAKRQLALQSEWAYVA
jgi:flavin-dependent dehydrogenase